MKMTVENTGQDVDAPQGEALTEEQRFNRVAEAAYLRAAARGFAGGDPMQDWLEAEAELIRSVNAEATASKIVSQVDGVPPDTTEKE